MKLKIRELREEKNLTQRELAAAIGNVQRNISNWENGFNEPDCESIVKLADIFGVTLDELFGRDSAATALEPNGEREQLIRAVLSLRAEQQTALLTLLRAFLGR